MDREEVNLNEAERDELVRLRAEEKAREELQQRMRVNYSSLILNYLIAAAVTIFVWVIAYNSMIKSAQHLIVPYASH